MSAEPARPVLELSGIHKRYGKQVAVHDLHLILRAGEFMTFLGPSGSGKTTTLMMVAGLQQPDRGRIVLNGAAVDRLPPHRRDIGMVFQQYALFPHMSVARNIAFPLELRGVPKAEVRRQVEQALRAVSLPGFGDRLPRELSGGQQQRVALARAMVYRPALLLMDEPLGALDRKLRGQMQIEILRVHRERRMSLLYVTHDQEEALTVSDRIAVFNGGAIEQVGTPAELYEKPATRFVAGFIGEMNFFPGSLVGEENGVAQVDVQGAVLSAANPEGLRRGSDVTVAVRPERVEVAARGAGGLPAVLEAVIYLGNARRLLLRLADGTECSALQPVGIVGATILHPGNAVSLNFRAGDANLFLR